jgi:hypothetical protein
MASHPDYIVHYNRSEPFRSVTSSSADQWNEIIAGMTDKTSWGLNRFKDAQYLLKRSAVELQMYRVMIANGGKPKLQHPFYLFLGRNWQFESQPSNIGYIIYLKDLHPDEVTFTYGDSLLS